MIYYVPLLMINNFENTVIEGFDKVLQESVKSNRRRLTPKKISYKLNISELTAIKLLAECERVGLVKLEYSMECKSCGTITKFNKLNNIKNVLCWNCNDCLKDENFKKINYYYLSLVK